MEYKLGIVEGKFADIIWENEPLTSGALVKLCGEKLEWKKSTTYTVLHKLCDRGIFKNEKGIVSSVLSKEELHARYSEAFVEETFGGSLPDFVAAFVQRKKLSEKELRELRKIIDSCEEV